MDYDLGFDAAQHQAVLGGVTFSSPFGEDATDLFRAWARGRGVMDAIIVLDLYQSFQNLQPVRTAMAMQVFLDQLVPGICDDSTRQQLQDGIQDLDPATVVDDLWGKATSEIQLPLYSRWKAYWEEFNRELQAYQQYWLAALQQDPSAQPGAPWGAGTGSDRYPDQYGTLPPIEESAEAEAEQVDAADFWGDVHERNVSVLAAISARKAATTETTFAYADNALVLGDDHRQWAFDYVRANNPANGLVRFRYKRVGPCEFILDFSATGSQNAADVQETIRNAITDMVKRGSWDYMSKPKIL